MLRTASLNSEFTGSCTKGYNKQGYILTVTSWKVSFAIEHTVYRQHLC